MPPQAYALAGVLVWNYRRDRAGLGTLSQFARRHPFAFIAVTAWLVPHVLNGSHLTDPGIRALDHIAR